MAENIFESIFDAATVNDFLRRELDRRLGSNPRYSMRAFARHLGMSPGELSEVLREKRPISARACQKVARALDLSPAEFKHLLVLATTTGHSANRANEAVPLKTALQTAQIHRLNEDRFRLVSDWWCLAILNLLDLDEIKWTSTEIADRFGISVLQAQSAMDRLERLSLVKKQFGDRAVPTNDFVEHLSEVSSEAIRRYHRSLLEKAIEALDTHDREQRDVTGIGFAIDRRELKAIAHEISEFQDQLIAKYGRKRRGRKFDSVYQFEAALFRLSPAEKK
jgi:uncharacterized protein (TIGR02147 family)